MNPTSPPGSQHTQFTAWAKSRGVTINGVETAQISGRGLGICANRKIKAGEELIKVPASALFTSKSLPQSFREKHDRAIGVHGLLASFLAFGGEGESGEDLRPWKASWPSMKDFESSMPLLWPSVVRDVRFLSSPSSSRNTTASVESTTPCCFPLPPAIGGRWTHPKMQEDCWESRASSSLLYKQEKRLNDAWEMVSKAIPEADIEVYKYYWLVVNSRSFYWEFPDEKPPEIHDDRMVLVPWADYFNHSDQGCNVSFDKEGYSVTSDRAYDVGEELYSSYGNHSNDFLLVEYGFTLDNNKWDSLPLDSFFTNTNNNLHQTKKTQLLHANYWLNYTLDSTGVCHRTQVAVRASTTNLARWKQFVAGREIDREREEGKADVFIVERILRVWFESAESAVLCLEGEEEREGEEDGEKVLPAIVRMTLLRRWKQIRRLVREAFENGINRQTQMEMGEIFNVG